MLPPMPLVYRIAVAAVAGALAGYGLARGGWAPWVANERTFWALVDANKLEPMLAVVAQWSALGMGGLAAALCAIFGRDDS